MLFRTILQRFCKGTDRKFRSPTSLGTPAAILVLLGLLGLTISALAQDNTTTQILRINLSSGSLTYRFNPNVASSALSQLRLDTTSKLNVAASASGSNPATLIKFSNNGLKRVSQVKPDYFDAPTSLAFDYIGNSYVGATYSGAH
jgi:hypothetical protein